MEEDENMFGEAEEEENEEALPRNTTQTAQISNKLKHVNWRVAMTSASKGQEQRSDMKAFFQCETEGGRKFGFEVNKDQGVKMVEELDRAAGFIEAELRKNIE